MNSHERRAEIVQTALQVGKVGRLELARWFSVSGVTIRTHLNQLVRQGLLVCASTSPRSGRQNQIGSSPTRSTRCRD
ncbi:DeoR family transcriptional regulator [Facivitalis istanbulensis]|uniref:DeoR family transcriptional regulator n=1 Tax=Facivitalis istanbulensis TaxID=3075838 RepID=UPI00387B8F20